MGNAVKSFAKSVATAVAKGAISGVGNMIPVVGGPLASYINSKFAKGSYDIGAVDVPAGAKVKVVDTPAKLVQMIQKFPEQAKKAGLTVDMVKEEVKEAKEQASTVSKAVGGFVSLERVAESSKKAVGDEDVKAPRAKKSRSEAQKKATERLVALNKERRKK
jgi:hypothetical protein